MDSLNAPDRVQLKRLLVWQAVVATVVVLAAFSFGLDAMRSAAVGAGACLIANWYFAYRVFQRYQARNPGLLLARIYWAELVKIAIALAVFGLAFALMKNVEPLALFGAYLAVQLVPAVLAQRPDARSNS